MERGRTAKRVDDRRIAVNRYCVAELSKIRCEVSAPVQSADRSMNPAAPPGNYQYIVWRVWTHTREVMGRL